MAIRRVLGITTAFLLLLPAVATAQQPNQTQIQLQYQEFVAADADNAPVLVKIFERIQRDCALVGKAFGRRCVISQINVNMNTNYTGYMSGGKTLNANATIILPPEPVEASPSPSTSGSAPAAPSR